MTSARQITLALAASLLACAAVAHPSPATREVAAISGPPFSESVKAGRGLYLSGQIGALPGTDTLVPGGVEAETRQAMDNIASVLASSGYDMNDLVHCTVMLADMTQLDRFNRVYRNYFRERLPTRSVFGVTGLSLGAHVEIECIASSAR